MSLNFTKVKRVIYTSLYPFIILRVLFSDVYTSEKQASSVSGDRPGGLNAGWRMLNLFERLLLGNIDFLSMVRYLQRFNSIRYYMQYTLPFPKCVFIDMYLAVPVSDLCSRYGICLFVSKSIYSLAKPKSEIQQAYWLTSLFI